MAIKIEPGRSVTLAYRLLDQDGRLLEERTPDAPFVYTHGQGAVVAPVERLLSGKTAGFAGEVTVSPREAYGDYDPALVVDVPRAQFESSLGPGVSLEVGMKFNTVSGEGRPLTVRVIEIAETTVTIDGNHPLAGLELTFEFKVLDVLDDREVDADSSAPAPLLVRTRRDVH